uniref:Tetraspanin n=1 Tax=Cyprinus carpio TaxID=7962 RepID=A0A8C2D2F8_CYPCA
MGANKEKNETCGTICLKYLLFTFNFLFWLAGGAVMAVGIWTLVEKSDYISLLSSKIYAVSAYILIMAGVTVMVTGVLGCCATFKEQRRLLRVVRNTFKYLLILLIHILHVTSQVLAGKYREIHINTYRFFFFCQFKCCGSNSSSDWLESVWIRSINADSRSVPDSCCKSPVIKLCGRRDHPSNIYKVEGGCITKLENFILNHLQIIGAVGVGIACVQIVGMFFTCCLYRSLKSEPY